ncbi:MAG: hypothetical protein ACL7BU_16615 [Candidatus Phlomobacter fragariae]
MPDSPSNISGGGNTPANRHVRASQIAKKEASRLKNDEARECQKKLCF